MYCTGCVVDTRVQCLRIAAHAAEECALERTCVVDTRVQCPKAGSETSSTHACAQCSWGRFKFPQTSPGGVSCAHASFSTRTRGGRASPARPPFEDSTQARHLNTAQSAVTRSLSISYHSMVYRRDCCTYMPPSARQGQYRSPCGKT